MLLSYRENVSLLRNLNRDLASRVKIKINHNNSKNFSPRKTIPKQRDMTSPPPPPQNNLPPPPCFPSRRALAVSLLTRMHAQHFLPILQNLASPHTAFPLRSVNFREPTNQP